jgi:hypothetical protein
MMAFAFGRRPQTIGDEYADTRQGEECLTTPLFDQLGRDHREGSVGPALSVGVNGP